MLLNLSKLDEFCYPKEVVQHLKTIFEKTIETLGDGAIFSIVLIGSTARGELSYRFNSDNTLDIFSDYEFIIVLKRGGRLSVSIVEILKANLSELKRNFHIRSPLFDIDFGIVSITKLKITPNTLWAYEVKENGVEVYGNGALKYLKTTNIRNLDFGNLNELIIVRLWNMLLHTDSRALSEDISRYSKFVLTFYYARNILDILTIYLPNKNILAPSYSERFRIYRELTDNCAANDLGQFGMAHDLKLKLTGHLTLEESQNTFINGYLALASSLSGFSHSHDTMYRLDELINIMREKCIFAEKFVRKIRRKKLEGDVCIFFLKKKKSCPQVLKWFLSDIRYDLFGGLICMHLSLNIVLNKQERRRFLEQAIGHLNKVIMEDIQYNCARTFEQNWRDVRTAMFDFMLIWFYGRSHQTIDDLNSVISWSDK